MGDVQSQIPNVAMYLNILVSLSMSLLSVSPCKQHCRLLDYSCGGIEKFPCLLSGDAAPATFRDYCGLDRRTPYFHGKQIKGEKEDIGEGKTESMCWLH